MVPVRRDRPSIYKLYPNILDAAPDRLKAVDSEPYWKLVSEIVSVPTASETIPSIPNDENTVSAISAISVNDDDKTDQSEPTLEKITEKSEKSGIEINECERSESGLKSLKSNEIIDSAIAKDKNEIRSAKTSNNVSRSGSVEMASGMISIQSGNNIVGSASYQSLGSQSHKSNRSNSRTSLKSNGSVGSKNSVGSRNSRTSNASQKSNHSNVSNHSLSKASNNSKNSRASRHSNKSRTSNKTETGEDQTLISSATGILSPYNLVLVTHSWWQHQHYPRTWTKIFSEGKDPTASYQTSMSSSSSMVSSATIGPSNSKDASRGGSRHDSRASTHDVSQVSEASAGVEMTREFKVIWLYNIDGHIQGIREAIHLKHWMILTK